MINDEVLDDQQRLIHIFHPYAMRKIREAREKNTRFAHYTTADAAMKILKTKQFWMRKTSCMNDYMEVQQGLVCLKRAYCGDVGERFKETLNGMFPGITSEIEERFNEWTPYFQNTTYIACFSEHEDADDKHGRLSMLRAYSESTGIALVLNNAPFLRYEGPTGVYSSPVSYLDDVSFEHEMQRIVEGIRGNVDFLLAQDQDSIRDAVFNAFKFAVLCTKHRAFSEEREWRAIYLPAMETSPHVEKSIETVGATPQPIYKFNLKNAPDIGFVGIEIPELLNRIIIGPTKYPDAMYEAFTSLLADAEVEDPASRVHVSGIPLRL